MARRLLLGACLVLVFVAAAPQAPAVPSPVFLQITDPQFGMAAANAGFAQETASMEFAIATANRLKPAFVIVTGDLVNTAGDASQMAEYKRVIGTLDRTIPCYNVPGNHDLGNEPTPQSVAAYVREFGPDHYSFQSGPMTGIVLNTTIIHTSKYVEALAAEQDRWFESELAKARAAGSRQIVVFQHHPVFIKDAAEPDSYENFPLARRTRYLAMLKQAGVTLVLGGHTHRNVVAHDGSLELVASAPIGMPLGPDDSGIRIGIARPGGIEHRYYSMGRIPNTIVPTAALPAGPGGGK